MRKETHRFKIGIVGCGAIGAGIARFVRKDLKKDCQLAALYDIDDKKARGLEKKISARGVAKNSLGTLIDECDLIVEAVNAQNTKEIVAQILAAKKDVMAMSVGKFLNAEGLFRLAKENHCHLLFPSGAIAGVDAVKAASLSHIQSIKLTTRKPPAGFIGNPYLAQKGIDLSRIKRETVLFQGKVKEAVQYFPQNINVAATLALAAGAVKKLVVCIMTSPDYAGNSHEVEVTGSFGRIVTRTDNVICADNPKTSYLAVLSGMQTLKQYCQGVWVGT